MNDNLITGKWKELKGELQRAWGKVTGDEFEQTKGNMKSIVGLIQQKYGMKLDEAHQKVSEIYGRFQDTKNEHVQDFKDGIVNKSEQAKENVRSHM